MKELEDFQWFPQLFRNFQTEFIGFVVSNYSIYNPFIEYLKNEPKHKVMFDLCSGSGEPARSIYKQSGVFETLVLSDKYPSSKEILHIDALNFAFDTDACYTMFNALHHFNDQEKLEIVQKIQKNNAKGFFVEILEPNLLFFLKVFITTTICYLLLCPFVKPFSLKRLLFTYLIPINILTITYDGIVSVCKSRSLKQYKKIFRNENVEVLKLKGKLSSLILIKIN